MWSSFYDCGERPDYDDEDSEGAWEHPCWAEAWGYKPEPLPLPYFPNETERAEYEAFLTSQYDDSEPF